MFGQLVDRAVVCGDAIPAPTIVHDKQSRNLNPRSCYTFVTESFVYSVGSVPFVR